MQKASKQLIALCLGAWGVIYGQTESRTSLIEAARTEKEANLTPETAPKLERKMVSIENSLPYRLITGESGGLSVGFGNVMPGAGFAAGPQYTRTGLWKGRLNFSVEARASSNESYVGRTDISLTNLFGDRVSLDFSAAHRNISEMAYYGAGPDSRKTGRSNYRLEDTNVELRPAFRVYKGLRSGLIDSYRQQRRPWTLVSIHFERAAVRYEYRARIDRQTNFWRGGGLSNTTGATRPPIQPRAASIRHSTSATWIRISAHTAFYGWIWTPRSISYSMGRGFLRAWIVFVDHSR
jgi:hypothetical protein